MNKTSMVALGLCLLVIAYTKSDAQKQQDPGVIRVSRLELVNGQGQVVGIIGTSNEQAAIQLSDANGSTVVKPGGIVVTTGQNRAIIAGQAIGVVGGNARAAMTIHGGDPTIMTSLDGKTLWNSSPAP